MRILQFGVGAALLGLSVSAVQGEMIGGFTVCAPGERVQCVEDARNVWLGSRLVQLDGIGDVPSAFYPACEIEAIQARLSVEMLTNLLNHGRGEAEVRIVGRTKRGVPLVRISTKESGDLANFLIGSARATVGVGDWC